ncbi:HD-GYP domain-containing protein [Paenibacillus sp. 1P07SE]|uniref:HD-GYP domain-containing protein n=1 Tax=Paenibacillus sp. 1P07SE TaxID=3132209 RepID=UPI0039A498D5
MPSIHLAQVKLGDKIAQDVHTPLGGILFHKGKIVTIREIEILNAFLVSHVVVESREGAMEQAAASAVEEVQLKERTSLHREYDALLELLKTIYRQFTTGQSMPILEIRTRLEALLQHIKEYNILTFLPEVAAEEDYIFHNSLMSAMTSYLLAQWVGLPQRDWMQVALAGLFHDIGNIKVDKDLLHKPASLTHAEIEEMKQHTVHGYQLLKNVPAINEGVKLTALQHHEKVDGSGYPLGVTGDNIHAYARIVAIADIFHAMTLKRSYRKAASPYIVMEQIQKESFGKLDPGYVQIFIEKATQFHNGMIVRLSDERIGEIVFSDRTYPTRPWVSVQGTIVNLTTERHLYIQEILHHG